VPFALKGWRIPLCRAERELRNAGLAVVDQAPVYQIHSPNTTSETTRYTEGGVTFERTVIATPFGPLTSVSRRVAEEKTEVTTWRIEPMFKGPDDYRKLEAMIEDRQYAPCYDTFLAAQARMDGEAFFKTSVPGLPLHTILYDYMGVEQFAVEWAERRDRVLQLNELMTTKQRRAYEIAATSPALAIMCGGNYAPEMLGLERFREFVLPHWEEAGSILHEGGKLMGCHLDANNQLWAPEIGASPLDWIEAFTPAPDTDMTLTAARAAWPGKTMFINFPSSVHLETDERIRQTTRALLLEAAPGDRFIVGITENVPENRWRDSFRAILETLNEYGELPIDRNMSHG
jgi:hypothetical protein